MPDVKKTDVHTVSTATSQAHIQAYGSGVYLVFNPRTGEIVDRTTSYAEALASKARVDALARVNGI